MMINDRIKKILRASTLAIIAMPIASYWTTNVYADPPANCYDLRTLDEIYTRSQSREASRAESDAHVKIAQIQADAQYRIEQLKATQENMRAERGSQSVLDHATIANAAIQTNATIEIEKIKADLEKARMEDARYREQLMIDKAKAKTEADKAIKLEQINSDKEIDLEQIRADKAVVLQQIEAERDKARLAAAAKARLGLYESIRKANEALRVTYNRAEQIAVERISTADAYNHRFFRKLREASAASDRVYLAAQADGERNTIVQELNAPISAVPPTMRGKLAPR